MRRQEGYAVWHHESGPPVEMDTVQCRHCQRHIFVKPNTVSTVFLIWNKMTQRWVEEPGAACRVCCGPVCLACHAVGTCTPFMRQVEQSERETAQRDALAREGRYTKGDLL